MKRKTVRTWKSRDTQAEAPLSWCRRCGSELYRGMRQIGLCPLCRSEERRRQNDTV